MIWGVRAPAQVSPCIILKGKRDQKNILCFPKVVSYDGEAFHVLEFDQHDFCVSRTLPRRSLTSDFVSKREKREEREKR